MGPPAPVTPPPLDTLALDVSPGLMPDPAALERSRRVELILRQIDQLPTLSPVAQRVMALSAADGADFDQLVRLIEADPALTGRLLSLCRRAAYGVAHSVTTVRRAAVLLGLETIQSAVLAAAVFELFAPPPGAEPSDGAAGASAIDREGFWRHSVAVACAAELLADAHRGLGVRPDEAFTAGLLHDLGKLALAWVLPRTYSRVVQLARSRPCELSQVERAVIGVDHHVAGKRLAEHWGLPHVLQDAMWLHGQSPAALPEVPHRPLLGVLIVADALCRSQHLGWSGNAGDEASLDRLCDAAGLDAQSLPGLRPRLLDAVAQRCAELGLGEASSTQLLLQSVSAANARLSTLNAALAQRAAGARQQARVLEALRLFTAHAAESQSVEDVLQQVARSFAHAAGRGFLAALVQARTPLSGSGGVEPWRLFRHDEDGAILLADAFEPPRDAAGRPVDLGALITRRGGDHLALGDAPDHAPDYPPPPGADLPLGGAITLLTWLSEHLHDLPGLDAPAPDLRSLRMLPLAVAGGAGTLAGTAAGPGHAWGPGGAWGTGGVGGPVALLLHERPFPATAPGEPAGPGADVLVSTWAWALRGAAQHQGARRLSEALAQTNRVLSQTQDRLAEAQSLARLGELTAGAAHEFNNPLTVISGRGQLLAARLRDARDRADAREIADAAARLTDLISKLHLVAKPPALERRATNLVDLCARVVRDAQERVRGPRARTPGVRDPAPAAPPGTLSASGAGAAGRSSPSAGARGHPGVRVGISPGIELASVDAPLLGRALVELVCNALECGPATAPELRIAVDPADGHLVITVRDAGPGLSDHARQHAFDPFFSDKPAGRQAGLGLSIARRIVALHGGTLTLESGPERGTVATVTIPDWRWAASAGERRAPAA